MAKTKISEWSATAANNTDINGIDIAEGCAPSGINNAIREMMAQIKDQQAGTDGDNLTVGGNLVVTGTTTLTGVPTAPTAATNVNNTQIATTAFVKNILSEVIYPVGSIYTSATISTNPNTLLGFGTWAAFGAGRVLVGNGGGFSAGATGGSADAVVVSHSHTATSSVSDGGHSHVGRVATTLGGSQGYSGFEEGRGNPDWATQTSTNSATTGISVATTVATAGVSGTNANLQPYVVVYMWNRTA
jgi:hypothetical protein